MADEQNQTELTHPESAEDMVSKLFERYDKRGSVMPPEQREIYEFISKRATGLTVCDIGCGTGIGTNLLGREARYVWGLDREQKTIDFAKQMFTRENLAGMGLVHFDVLDLTNPPNREYAKFHIITCIDVLEHIEDYQTALNTIKKMYEPGRTTLYISTPNNNNEKFPKDKAPINPHHVRQWTAAQFYDILVKNFQSVTLFSHNMIDTVDLDTTITPIVARIEGAIL